MSRVIRTTRTISVPIENRNKYEIRCPDCDAYFFTVFAGVVDGISLDIENLCPNRRCREISGKKQRKKFRVALFTQGDDPIPLPR